MGRCLALALSPLGASWSTVTTLQDYVRQGCPADFAHGIAPLASRRRRAEERPYFGWQVQNFLSHGPSLAGRGTPVQCHESVMRTPLRRVLVWVYHDSAGRWSPEQEEAPRAAPLPQGPEEIAA